MTAPRNDLPSDPQLSRLYREHALAEPSDAVDQRLLALARQAAVSPAPRRQGWWPRWRMPLSLATTVMLTVMLALLVERQPAELPAAPGAEKKTLESVRERAEPASAPPVAAKAARVPAAPALHKSLPDAAGGQGGGESENRAAGQQAEMPAPSAPPAAAPSAAAVSSERRAAPALLAAPPAAAPWSTSTADSARAPAAWLDEIRSLRRAGKTEEAARQLGEFRLAYPEYPLPEEFRQ